MDDENRALADLLRRAAPEPSVTIAFDQIAARVRRRRTAAWMGAAGAVGALVAATAVLAGVYGGEDHARDTSVAVNTPSSAPGGTSSGAGCPPTEPYPDRKSVMVDYVPFIQLGGQQFVGHLDGGSAPSRADLGDQIATVTCRIADLTESGTKRVVGGFLEGNASYLRAGMPIYAVDGFAANCRVAAIENGQVTAYLAQHEVDNRSVPTACATEPNTAHP